LRVTRIKSPWFQVVLGVFGAIWILTEFDVNVAALMRLNGDAGKLVLTVMLLMDSLKVGAKGY
jgi:hypothetical protein